MKIQILGSGCKKCTQLAEVTQAAANELELDYTLEKVTDMEEILSFSILMTPALVVDGDVKFSGKVSTKEEITNILKDIK